MSNQMLPLHIQAVFDLQSELNRAFSARGYADATCTIQFDVAQDVRLELQCHEAGVFYKAFYLFKDRSDWIEIINEARAFIFDLPEAGDYRIGKLRERVKEDLEQLDDVTLDQAEIASIRARLESVIESLSSNIIEDKTGANAEAQF